MKFNSNWKVILKSWSTIIDEIETLVLYINIFMLYQRKWLATQANLARPACSWWPSATTQGGLRPPVTILVLLRLCAKHSLVKHRRKLFIIQKSALLRQTLSTVVVFAAVPYKKRAKQYTFIITGPHTHTRRNTRVKLF